LALLMFAVPAAAESSKFSVATYLGLHRPALEDINKKEFKAPLAGVADYVDELGVNRPTNIQFDNPLPELGAAPNAGLEFQWWLNERYVFLVGMSSWEASSRAIAKGDFFIQGKPADVVSERSARMSYNEYYFGFRYNIISKNDKYKLYYRATFNEMFDIDMREDLVFLFLSGDAAGVKKSIILQSQATGLILLQPGFGGEYFVKDWFSIALEASYVIGMKKIHLRDGNADRDFLATDNLSIWLPQRIGPESGDLEYLSSNPVDGDDYNELTLSFDGWKTLVKMSIYF